MLYIIVVGLFIICKVQGEIPLKWQQQINTQNGYQINHGPDTDDNKLIWVELIVQNQGWISFQVRQGNDELKSTDLYLFYLTFLFKDGKVISYEYDNDFISYNEKLVEIGENSNIVLNKAEYINEQYHIIFKRVLEPTEAIISICGRLHYAIRFENNNNSMELPEQDEYENSSKVTGNINFEKSKYKCINKILTPPEAIYNQYSSLINVSIVQMLIVLLFTIQ